MFINIEPQQKKKIFCDVYKYRNPTKGINLCHVYKTIAKNPPKMSNLSNCLKANQYIDCDMFNHKNRHTRHNLPQTCWGIKSPYPVCIRPIDNL